MLKIYKCRDVKTPSRGTGGSAGLDFYVPDDWGEDVIYPAQSAIIPSGIHVLLEQGTALVMFNKSGVALSLGLQVGACVIDEDYQGEIHLHLTNISDRPALIKPGQKLVQGLVLQVAYDRVYEEPSLDALYPETTERGTGAFGSTNNKH